jgi:hypothetical protein
MNNPGALERFTQHVDAILNNPLVEIGQESDPHYQELLELSRRLALADASSASRKRGLVREQLVQRTRQRAIRQPAAHAQPGQNWLTRMALIPLIMTGLVIGAIWAVGYLLPRLLPQPPSAASGTATPLATSPAISAPGLTLASNPQEVLERALNPLWQAAWLDGTLQELNSAGEWQTTRFQVWLDRSGLGRALESDPQPGLLDRTVEAPVRFVSLADGERMAMVDVQTGKSDPAFDNFAWTNHPLENAGNFMSLLYPNFLSSEGGDFQIVGEETFIGLQALVIEWTPLAGSVPRHRFHIDTRTGALLSHKVLAEDGLTVIREVQARGVVFDIPVPPVLTTLQAVPLARFADGPQPPDPSLENLPFTKLPTPGPLPTPTTFVLPTSTTIVLSVEVNPVESDNTSGELFLQMMDIKIGQASLLRVSATCLVSQQICQAQQINEPVESFSAPLYWSPDGGWGLQFDTVNQQVLALVDPANGGWQTLAQGVLPYTELAYWSPDNAWATISAIGSDGNTNPLTLIRADGSETRQPAADLGASQVPLGWIDANTVLFLHFGTGGKGLSDVLGQVTPTVYQVDINSGVYTQAAGLSGNQLLVNYPSPSPDGKTLAVVTDEPGMLSLYDLTSGQITSIAEELYMPVWSPDGQWIAGIGYKNSAADLDVIQPSTGERRRLFTWPSTPVFAWAPDSQHLLVEASPRPEESHARQYLVAVDGTPAQEIIIEGDTGQIELRHPAWRNTP